MRTWIWIVLSFSGWSIAARSEILMIDLNHSYKEVEAARQAARLRNETLVVIPERDPALEKSIIELRERAELARQANTREFKKYEDLLKQMENSKDPARKGELKVLAEATYATYKAGNEDILRLKQQLEPLNQKVRKVNAEILQGALRKLEEQKRPLSSIILSGHHSGGRYSGEHGTLGEWDLFDSIKKFPGVSANLNSLYLWGCYTATVEKVIFWKNLIPSLKVIAGFDDSAPSQNWTANLSFLRSVMVKEKELSLISDVKAAQRAYREVEGTLQTRSSLCMSGVCVTRSGAATLDDPATCPPQEISKVKLSFRDYYPSCDLGRAPCEVLPSDTQRSPLRDLYSALRKFAHCKGLDAEKGEADRMIRMIFQAEVNRNFSLYYAKDIQRLKEMLARWRSGSLEKQQQPTTRWERLLSYIQPKKSPQADLGLTREIEGTEFPDLANRRLSRSILADFGSRLSMISSYSRGSKIPQEEQDFVQDFGGRFYKMLINLRCVPLDWIEPVVTASALSAPGSGCGR